MSKYIITTDNTSDLPKGYIDEKTIPVMSLQYMLDGNTYDKDNSLPYPEFYQMMRDGKMPTTSQANPSVARELFEPLLEEGYDIIHLAFSSGLSGTYNSVRIAAEELKEEMPERRITVIDTLAASLGEGLLVHKALELQAQGKSYDEVVDWVETNKLHLCHIFTVDDLNHLHRGGRISAATAVLGTIVNIKPILHVDNEGHLVSLGKARGRKKSIQDLVKRMGEQMGSYRDQNDVVFISHGDCEEDANYLAEQVKKEYGIESFLIDYVGPTIGAHSGPGTLALFFLGEAR